MKDIRLSIGIFQHPKIIKLRRRHGADGVLALLQLWIYTALNCPKGILIGMDPESVTIAAQWQGNESWFRDLLDLKLIDETPDGYGIHDWKDHNGYAYFSPERSEQAKRAATERWSRNYDNKQEPNASRIPECNAPSPSPSPPLREKGRSKTSEQRKTGSAPDLREAISRGLIT